MNGQTERDFGEPHGMLQPLQRRLLMANLQADTDVGIESKKLLVEIGNMDARQVQDKETKRRQ
jgi:hypothetical protein